MADAKAVLDATKSILLIDWPSRDVPDTLAHGGFTVSAQEGPDRYAAYELTRGDVHQRINVGRPASVDLVYAYRPLDELPDIIELARELRARAIWLESDRSAEEIEAARHAVEGAGLAFVSEPNIADAVRARGNGGSRLRDDVDGR